MTLWDLAKKKAALVKQIDNELDKQVIARLKEMGLSEGQTVQCVRRGPLGGPMVIQLGGSVFAIERALSSRIEIIPQD